MAGAQYLKEGCESNGSARLSDLRCAVPTAYRCDAGRQNLCLATNHAAAHIRRGIRISVDGCRTGGQAMPIAPTLHRYLARENIQYDEIPHVYTMTSARTAQAAHVPGDRVAKAIVLRRNGGYMLAVLPASHHLRIADLRERLGEDVDMASEGEIAKLFVDCANGAVPA